MKTGASLNRGGSKQDFETPPGFIRAVEERFGQPTFDLAASKENAKANLFFALPTDSLQMQWHQHNGLCWLNPPFSNIAPWAKKCVHESKLGARILFLTPASVGSNWFSQHVFKKANVLFLNKRLQFVGAKDPYPKDCMLSCFGFAESGFEIWTWK